MNAKSLDCKTGPLWWRNQVRWSVWSVRQGNSFMCCSYTRQAGRQSGSQMDRQSGKQQNEAAIVAAALIIGCNFKFKPKKQITVICISAFLCCCCRLSSMGVIVKGNVMHHLHLKCVSYNPKTENGTVIVLFFVDNFKYLLCHFSSE